MFCFYVAGFVPLDFTTDFTCFFILRFFKGPNNNPFIRSNVMKTNIIIIIRVVKENNLPQNAFIADSPR